MLKSLKTSFTLIQKIVDSFTCVFFFYLAYLIRFHYIAGAQEGQEFTFVKLAPLLVALTLYSFSKNGLYKAQRYASKYYEVFSLVRGNTMALTFFVLVVYFFAEARISRLTIVIYFLLSSVGFIALRLIIRNLLRSIRKKGHNLRHVLLIGNGHQISEYIQVSKTFKDSGIRFMGWIDSEGRAEEHGINAIEQDYNHFKKGQLPDSIVLAYQGDSAHKAATFIQTHYNDIIPIQLLPDLSYSMIGHQIQDFGGIPILSVNQPNFNSTELFFKRLLEFLAALIGIIFISPLLLMLSLLTKLSSPGPIFFGQERIGLNGELFKMWKFRSMKQPKGDDSSKEWSQKNNPRKTKMGDFLRRTSLDELPQLWNVLKGEMSLVGPRPEQPFFVEKFRNEIPGYMLKHKMKPGITGWAQVNGWRGDTSLEKRIECDIYYIKNWSLLFDAKVILLTFTKGFINKNAY